MNKLLNNAVVVIFLLALFGSLGMDSPVTGDKKRAAIVRHRAMFESVYRMKAGQNAKRMVDVLKNIDTAVLSAGEWRELLGTLVEDSRRGTLKRDGTAFVQDEEVVDILVSAIEDSPTGDTASICDTLTWETENVLREKYAERIRKALGPRPKVSERIYLYAKCGLSFEQKKEVCSWEDAPAAVKALCGDSKAETNLIFRFRQETEYFEKGRLARQVAYVGSHSCSEALIEALRSPIIIDSEYEICSIRSKILQALGLIYSKEKLFTKDAYVLESSSDEVFDMKCNLKKYIAELNDWGRARFGHPAWENDDVWFRRMKNVPIIESVEK